MTTPKLEPGTPLPCPFCGGEPKRLNDGQGMSIFQCQKCTACHIRTFNNEAAIERWNTRHPDPRQQEKIEALVKAASLDGFYVNNSPTGVTPVTDLTEHEVHDYCNKLIKQGYTVEAVSQMRTAAIVGRRVLAALAEAK